MKGFQAPKLRSVVVKIPLTQQANIQTVLGQEEVGGALLDLASKHVMSSTGICNFGNRRLVRVSWTARVAEIEYAAALDI